jgi:hypothetical protein
MQILELDLAGYCAAESDLCNLHRALDSDEAIERELHEIQAAFQARFPQLTCRKDYEFPDWHHHLRLFWVYLYHDDFYTPEFIPFVQQILRAAPRSWFAEFECYSPALVRQDTNAAGFVGEFLIYKETIMFAVSKNWATVKDRLGIKGRPNSDWPGACQRH